MNMTLIFGWGCSAAEEEKRDWPVGGGCELG
jgi:hypothetical protein